MEDDKTSRVRIRSSITMQSLSHFFRRGYKPRIRRTDSITTFCGYSLERDYCVDLETDRTFKEFLCGSSSSSSSLPTVEETRSLTDENCCDQIERNRKELQRRRKTFKKQYSDSVATYYEQKERREKLIVQRNQSINYSENEEMFSSSQERSEDSSDWSEVNSIYSTAASSMSDVFDYSSADTAMFVNEQSNSIPRIAEDKAIECKQN